MTDQAEALRRLARQFRSDEQRTLNSGLVAVVGSGRGMGTSTFCLHYAATLSGQSWKVTLIDADPRVGNLAASCALRCSPGLDAFIQGQRTLRELIQVGPCGVRVIAGSTSPEAASSKVASALAPAVVEMSQSGLVLLDLGTGQEMQPLLAIADHVLLVGRADAEGILESYQTLKRLVAAPLRATLWLVSSQVEDARQAKVVQNRLVSSADRFLNMQLKVAGILPEQSEPAINMSQRNRFLSSGYASAVRDIAQRLSTASSVTGSVSLAVTSDVSPAKEPSPYRRREKSFQQELMCNGLSSDNRT